MLPPILVLAASRVTRSGRGLETTPTRALPVALADCGRDVHIPREDMSLLPSSSRPLSSRPGEMWAKIRVFGRGLGTRFPHAFDVITPSRKRGKCSFHSGWTEPQGVPARRRRPRFAAAPGHPWARERNGSPSQKASARPPPGEGPHTPRSVWLWWGRPRGDPSRSIAPWARRPRGETGLATPPKMWAKPRARALGQAGAHPSQPRQGRKKIEHEHKEEQEQEEERARARGGAITSYDYELRLREEGKSKSQEHGGSPVRGDRG